MLVIDFRVLVKDHKASFYKNEIRAVYQVEYNLQT